MADHSPAHPEWKPRHNPWLITFSVLLATFMEVLDTSVANVSLPHIAGNLSVSIDESTWVLTSYLVSNAIILSATAWFSRRFGRKKYLAFSVIVFTLSSALCGMAQSLPQLVWARVLQGLGGGGLQPLAQAIMLESFAPEDRGAAMAAYGLGIVVAPIIGPTLGGWITDNYSWRWIFYINIPIGILGLTMQEFFVEDPPYIKRESGGRIDGVGFGLLALGIGTLQIILDRGQDADWFGALWIRWGTALVIASLAFFIWWELNHENPIVNLRVLKDRNFAVGTTLMAALGAILYGTTVLLPIFMQDLMGYTAYRSGLAMTPRGVGSFFSMLLIGRLVRKVENRLLILIGFSGVAVTCLILSRLNLQITQANISWPLVFNGLSMGFIFVPMTTLSVSTLRQDEIYQATGIYSLMRNIGAGIGISLLVSLQSRAMQGHQMMLVSHLTPYDPAFEFRLHAFSSALRGASRWRAAQTAHEIIYHLLLQQAALLSFMDSFRWLAFTCVLCAPLVYFFRKPRLSAPVQVVVE